MHIIAAGERETENHIVSDGPWSQEYETVRKMVPTLRASASYEKAVRLGKKLIETENPRELFELHDMLSKDPMADQGFSGFGELLERAKCRLIEMFRAKVSFRGGWGLE